MLWITSNGAAAVEYMEVIAEVRRFALLRVGRVGAGLVSREWVPGGLSGYNERNFERDGLELLTGAGMDAALITL